jgi:carbon storage regulator
MLVLSRKVNQKIRIGEAIELKILEVRNGKVKLGLVAPWDVAIHRAEVSERIERECRELVLV